MWLTTGLVLLGMLVVGIAAAITYGRSRWQGETRDFRGTLEAAALPAQPARYDARETHTLPPPVRRYFQAVLQDGQPLIAVARLSEAGQFRLSEAGESWGPFHATHLVTVRPPAFDWDARIAWAPGIKMFVRDAYAAGEGILHAAAFGFFTVADQRGTPEMAEGELMRYLAEAPWYPTALLHSQGVRWEAMDDSTARASLADGATRVTLEFRFDEEGLITSVWSAGRYRDVNGVQTMMPWRGRFRGYTQRLGVRIPLEGEVEWITPTGPLPYWRGRITDITYETAP